MKFYTPRPQRLCLQRDPDGPLLCPKKPDLDNLVKAVKDALVRFLALSPPGSEVQARERAELDQSLAEGDRLTLVNSVAGG